jgi:hypothetical protein
MTNFAGHPATTVLGATSFATTLPPPTTAFSPTVTLGRMVTPPPIAAPSLIIGGFKKLLFGYLSFRRLLFGAMNTLSPSTQPFEMVT